MYEESLLTLGVGRFEVFWGKYTRILEFGDLFLPDDLSSAPYFYWDHDHERPRLEERPAYVRSMASVKRRLDVLGYTLEACCETYDEEAGLPYYVEQRMFTSAEYLRTLKKIDVDSFELTNQEGMELGDFARTMFNNPGFARTPTSCLANLQWDTTFFENLDPYVTLRFLAENPENPERDLVWRHLDVPEDLRPDGDVTWPIEVADDYKTIIITAGSSDTKVLRKSLSLALPDVADLFEFVDMQENYPFTGTGNVVKFLKGLIKLGIRRKVCVVLDNDLEGCLSAARIKELSPPDNIVVFTLPDLPEAQRWPTLGPNGALQSDVNGRAVAIEFFLLEDGEAPPVRWSSFREDVGEYQGAMIEKERILRRFLSTRGTMLPPRLLELWGSIYSACAR